MTLFFATFIYAVPIIIARGWASGFCLGMAASFGLMFIVQG